MCYAHFRNKKTMGKEVKWLIEVNTASDTLLELAPEFRHQIPKAVSI